MLDGIFGSLVEGAITNENYFSYVTEAEVMEEMEKLDNMETSVNLPEDPYDACYESMLINQQNYHNVLMSIALEEMNYYSNTGMEMVYEGARLDALFSKIKSLVDRAWEKIKKIYEKVLKTIASWVMSDAKLVQKYKKEIQESTKEQRTIRGTYEIKNDVVQKTDIYRELVSGLQAVIHNYNHGKDEKDYENIEKEYKDRKTGETKKRYIKGKENTNELIEKTIMYSIKYNDCENTEDFAIKLREDFGLDKLVEKVVLAPAAIISELSDGNTTKKNIQAAYKAAKSSVANFKAIIEKTKKEVEKDSKKSIKDSDDKYTFSNLTKGCNFCMTILSILQREQVKASNIYHKNCRKAANRALRGVGTTESYEYENNLYNYNTEFSFIR